MFYIILKTLLEDECYDRVVEEEKKQTYLF